MIQNMRVFPLRIFPSHLELRMCHLHTKAVWVGNKKYSDLILCPESNLHWSHSNFKLLGIEFSLDLNRITEIHFSKKIKEVSAILKSCPPI
jgi:hypothetical protein